MFDTSKMHEKIEKQKIENEIHRELGDFLLDMMLKSDMPQNHKTELLIIKQNYLLLNRILRYTTHCMNSLNCLQ